MAVARPDRRSPRTLPGRAGAAPPRAGRHRASCWLSAPPSSPRSVLPRRCAPGFDKGGSHSEKRVEAEEGGREPRAGRLSVPARRAEGAPRADGEGREGRHAHPEEKRIEAEFTEEQLERGRPVEDVILAEDAAGLEEEEAPVEEVSETVEPVPAELATVEEAPVDDKAEAKPAPGVEPTLEPVPAVEIVETVDEAAGAVTLLTSELPAMAAGQAGWVSLNWLAGKLDATEFRVTATEASGAVTISYPESTGRYSSLYRESFLLAGGTDYTSFRFEVAGDASSSVEIVFRVSYRGSRQRQGQGRAEGDRGGASR